MKNGHGSSGWALPALAAALVFCAVPATAQLQSASSAGLGTADNYTALARGFAALGLNPAALGLPESPGFSLALIPVSVQAGVDPVTLGDLKDFEGRQIPDATKNDWLDRIGASGSEEVLAGARASALSLTVGNFGLQASTIAHARASISEPVAELLLFGNAGRTGSPADLTLTGSTMDAWAVTTVGASFGLRLGARIGTYENQSFAVGATLKYSVGNALLLGRERGGSVTSDPVAVSVQFPVVQTDTAGKKWSNGSGVGLDVGAAWEGGPWSVGLAVHNLFNTFEWDRSKLFFRPGEAIFNASTKDANVGAVPAEGTPAADALLSEVGHQKFDPILVAAAAYDISPMVTVMGEWRNRFGDGMEVVPKLHLGAGVEVRPAPLLKLRAGLAGITDGFQVAGGGSLVLGPVNLSGAYLRQSGNAGDASFGQLTLSFVGR